MENLIIAAAKITTASDLIELRDALNVFESMELPEGQKTTDYVDYSNLPTFGGEEPTDTYEKFSWDADNLMVSDGNKWILVPRIERDFL